MTPIEKAIREFHERVSALENVIDVLDDALDITPESPLRAATQDLIGGYIAALGAAYNIDSWLEWWWEECNLGGNPLRAGIANSPMKEIKTIDDFVQLVIDDRGVPSQK